VDTLTIVLPRKSICCRSVAVASRLRKRILWDGIVSGALFQDVRMPHVCKAISIKIEYGMKSSADDAAKNHASAGQSNSAFIVPVAGLQSTPNHLGEPRSDSMPATLSTRVVSARSKAGLRLDVLSSKHLKSSPRHNERLLHMNSHMLTQDRGSSPGT